MFTKHQTPLELVEVYPQTDPVFRSYDDILGKCLLCHHLFDPLETIAQLYGLDLTDLIHRLEEAIIRGEGEEPGP